MIIAILTMLLFFIVYAALCGALIGAGLALSYLLRWAWPSIDFGTGLLIGVVTASIAFHFFLRIYYGIPAAVEVPEGKDEDAVEPPVFRDLPPLGGRRKRKQRREW